LLCRQPIFSSFSLFSNGALKEVELQRGVRAVEVRSADMAYGLMEYGEYGMWFLWLVPSGKLTQLWKITFF
jgi:hypothetical protein